MFPCPKQARIRIGSPNSTVLAKEFAGKDVSELLMQVLKLDGAGLVFVLLSRRVVEHVL